MCVRYTMDRMVTILSFPGKWGGEGKGRDNAEKQKKVRSGVLLVIVAFWGGGRERVWWDKRNDSDDSIQLVSRVA